MKKMKRMGSLLLAAGLVLQLAGCGGQGTAAAAATAKPAETTAAAATEATAAEATTATTAAAPDTTEKVDLVFYVMGNAPEDEAAVEKAVNDILLEKVNATVDFQFSTWTDWSQKYNLQLTTGGTDLIYVASWNNFGTLATSGAFLPLDELLTTCAPDIVEAVDASLLNMCRADGALYAIPNTWAEYTCNGIKYREDLRAQYDLPVPDTLENMEAFFAGIRKNLPDQRILTVTTQESSGLQAAFDAFNVFNVKYPWVTNNGFPYGLAANLDTPVDVYDYWKSQDFIDDVKLMKKWADMGFWSRSALSDSNSDESYVNGLCVAEVAGQNPNKFITSVKAFEKDHPEWKSGYYAYGEATGSIYPASPIQNATAIVRDSKNPERAMMVLNLMLTDATLNRLVQCGVEGTHFELTSDGNYKNLSETFPYEGFNTWNLRNGLLKLPQESDALLNGMFDSYKTIGEKAKYPNLNLYAGFTEDYSEYQVERAAVSDVMRQYLAPLEAGFVEDVDAAVAEFLKKAEDAGLQTCRDAFTEQWLEYCEEYGYN